MFKSFDNNIFYHTNVVMSVGKDCVVYSPFSIIKGMNFPQKDVVRISKRQADNFCANILFFQDHIIMSERAFRNFKKDQIKMLEKHGNIIKSDLSTVEDLGGGSARCMLAEIFD